jgi:hypothetical protein
LSATPPLIRIGAGPDPPPSFSSSSPRASAATREASARWMPRTIPSSGCPSATSPITSLSAKTVQVEETVTGRSARAATAATSSSGTWSRARITSRKRPVPAAHLSFIPKSITSPAGPIRIAFESCPPMSTRIPGVAASAKAPRAWQVISVSTVAPGTRFRP